MTVVPKETAVTKPVLDMVATPVLLEVHGLLLAAVADPVNCVVALTQMVFSPEIVGSGLTLTSTFCKALQPVVGFVAVTVYIVVVEGVTVILEVVTPFVEGNVFHW